MPRYANYGGLDEVSPIAQVDDYVKILYRQEVKYRKVVFYEPIPAFQCIDLGAIATGGQSNKINIVNLELDDEEFGQFRIWCLENVQAQLYLPSGQSRSHLKNLDIRFDKLSALRNPTLSLLEINVWEDNRPAVQAFNTTDYPLLACRFIAKGFRFHVAGGEGESLPSDILSKLKSGDLASTPIWCSGYGAGTD